MPVGFSLNDFRSNLTYGGARPSLFRVEITNPVDGSADLKVPFMVKAASLPASTLGKITVPFMGRVVNYGGDREFEDWTVTVISDEDFLVRNAMEAWSNAVNSHSGDSRAYPELYKSQALVTQLGKDGTALRVYKMMGVFPTMISAIDLSWEQQNTIEEFQVTFAFDDWTVDGGTTGRSTT